MSASTAIHRRAGDEVIEGSGGVDNHTLTASSREIEAYARPQICRDIDRVCLGEPGR